jgi:hypothetical protein
MITLAEYLLALYTRGVSDEEQVYIEDGHPYSGLIEED